MCCDSSASTKMLNAIRSHARKYLRFVNAKQTTSSNKSPNTTAATSCAICTSATSERHTSVLKRFITNTSRMTSARRTLQGRGDRYNGVVVDSISEVIHPGESFQEMLLNSLSEWAKANKRGIWFKVHITHSDWIPILVKNGFTYHHAKQDYVMLLNWLPKSESCNVPPYAHTMVGVGAVVISEDNEVLVVSEKYFDRAHWKLPGGYVEPGENFVDAAIREVYEETNIHTEFRSVLAFRHGHGGQFQCSDLYTVVSLKPLSTDVKKCEREIQDCKWMKVEEYMTHPDIHELNRLFVHKYLENGKFDMKIECSHGIHQVLKKPYTVYHAVAQSESDKNENEPSTSTSNKL